MRPLVPLLASLSIAALPSDSPRVAQPAPICVTGAEWIRGSGFTQFTGVLQQDSVRAYAWPSEVNVSRYSTDTAQSGKTFARLLHYTAIQGPAESASALAVRPPAPPAVYIVPWQTDDDCRRVAWTDPQFPIPGADSVFVSVQVRPRGDWIRGIPTADLDGSSRLYARAIEIARARRHSTPIPTRLPSAGEYFDAFQHFPSAARWPCTTQTEYETLRDWLAARPALRDQPLFRDMLRSIAEAARETPQLLRNGVCGS